jgi:hypothetical protein
MSLAACEFLRVMTAVAARSGRSEWQKRSRVAAQPSRCATAVTRLVLGPLGMTGSSFPASWPYEDPDAVTDYELEPDGTFVPDLDDLTAILLAAGLSTTATDLVRFGTGWSSLMPAGIMAKKRCGRRPPPRQTSASAGASTWPTAAPRSRNLRPAAKLPRCDFILIAGVQTPCSVTQPPK